MYNCVHNNAKIGANMFIPDPMRESLNTYSSMATDEDHVTRSEAPGLDIVLSTTVSKVKNELSCTIMVIELHNYTNACN